MVGKGFLPLTDGGRRHRTASSLAGKLAHVSLLWQLISMLAQERENRLVEGLGLLPGDRVAGFGD